ncbi:MAG TPA: hypothetical protein VJB57_08810, partial [Dehalococcoidia bacterium]|nr:hypothetical protein [Dehalococcoidia bacterium]
EEYARSWNGDGGIARYVLDRSAAENEAVIILEYAPHTMWRWLTDSPGRVDDVIDQVFQSIAMLRANGVVHFDAHFANVVTDGAAHLLTDFGLWLDSQFELSAEERAFLQRHIDYDYGEVLMSAGDTLTWTFFLLPEGEREAIRRELGIHRTDGNAAIGRILIARLEDLAGLMPVEGVLLEAVRRYRPVMLFMSEFLSAMRSNPRKDTPFEADILGRLLDEVGVDRVKGAGGV